MSLFDSIANVFYPTSDQEAQGAQLDAKLRAKNEADYSPGGDTYERILASQGIDAANDAYSDVRKNLDTGSTAALIKTGDENYDATHAKDSGIGALLKDTLLLAAIGGAVWAFLKFGGAAWLKALSRKAKWAPLAIAGVAILGAWWIYKQVKKTGSDASSFGANIADSVKTIL